MTDPSTTQRAPAPAGTRAAGRRLWRSVVDAFDLEEHELALLREAVRTVDQLDQLAAVVAEDGPMVDGKVHPALTESRQLRPVLARLLASLRVPEDDDTRPQRRGAARGTYRKAATDAP